MSTALETKRVGRKLNVDDLTLSLDIPIGGSGAVGTVTGMGQTAVALNGTGDYTITLDRGYLKLRNFIGTVHRAASGALLTPTVRQSGYTSGSTSLEFFVCDTSGVVQQPSSGDHIHLEIVFDCAGIGL